MAGLVFRRRHRISLARDYAACFRGRLKAGAGPLMVFARPNGLAEPRLGLSVGRKAGNAVTRNRAKRALREAFRTLHGSGAWAGCCCAYDLVVSVRKHEPLAGGAYRELLERAVAHVDRTHRKRIARTEAAGAGPRAAEPAGRGRDAEAGR